MTAAPNKCQPEGNSVRHRVVVSEGAWSTAKCTCRWFVNKWGPEEAEAAAKAHIQESRP